MPKGYFADDTEKKLLVVAQTAGDASLKRCSLGCECVCFGMPFYAGWGVTTDKSECKRRKAKRSVEEIFAAAYILYYNPYTKKESDIFDVVETIVEMK